MGRSACLSANGGNVVEHQMRSLLSFSSTVTYSPNTTTNKKPALGGLEKAQAKTTHMRMQFSYPH
jgi:hypothetical protein